MTLHDDYQAAMLALNPGAYWTFQGLAPGALFDVSGNGHTLTAHGAVDLAHDLPGWDGFQAVLLDGASAYLTSTYAPVDAEFSVVVVHWPTTAPGELLDCNNAALTKGFTVGLNTPGGGSGLNGLIGNGSTRILAQDPLPYYQRITGPVLEVFSLTGGAITLAVGSSVPIVATPAPVYVPSALGLVIGRYGYFGTPNAYRGWVSDLAYLPGALSADAVASLAGASPGATPATVGDIMPTLLRILAAVTYRAY